MQVHEESRVISKETVGKRENRVISKVAVEKRVN